VNRGGEPAKIALGLLKLTVPLRFLEANGYPLAAVKEVITGDRTSEGVYAEYCC
jgi:hypothetical protein